MHDPPPLQLISSLPLRRLSANLDELFGHAGVDFRNSLFNQLTHLSIFGTDITDTWPKNLGSLPCLTHLSIYWFNGANPPFRGILAECKLLEVLLLIFVDEYEKESWENYRYFGEDPRSILILVTRFLVDWEKGATGGEDYWVRAEIFIQQRRSGKIKGESSGDYFRARIDIHHKKPPSTRCGRP
jgi:hypothetical protein